MPLAPPPPSSQRSPNDSLLTRSARSDSAPLADWVSRRKPGWDKLSDILLRAGTRGTRSLNREDLRVLGPLYRRAASDLAHARLRGGDAALIAYLNGLVTRAHGLLYAERGPGGNRLKQFILYGFPALLRRRAPYIFAAAFLFFIGGIIGAAMTQANPEVGRVFLGNRADDTDFYKNLPTELTDEQRPIFAATLMQNNTRVAILAFAVGILGGVPTLLLLFYNGLPIGSLAVLQHNAGYDVVLWSFLLPHGVPELSAIFIAGGAGMLIGHALVAPGELTRRDAIALAGRDAVRLLLGTVMLFVIAGFVESFVSPTAMPAPFKFAFAAISAVALWSYCRLGKNRDGVERAQWGIAPPASGLLNE